MSKPTDFTEEQKEKILVNLYAIEEYLRDVQTRISEPVSSFFETGYDKLCVDKDSVYIDGFNSGCWYFDEQDEPVRLMDFFWKKYVKNDIVLAYNLCLDWKYIKKNLERKIRKQSEQRRKAEYAIENFTV